MQLELFDEQFLQRISSKPSFAFTCQAKIRVTKIKGATSYYFSCGYEIKKEKGTVVLAKTTGSVKKFPKKIKLKVFAKRKINSYSVAYGEVSKAKTVKIR